MQDFLAAIYINFPWGILAGVITLILVTILRPLARKTGLLDSPGGRKTHAGNIPLIGGICIYVTISGTFLMTEGLESEIKWLLGSASLLILLGVADDLFDIRAIYKLAGQVAASCLMIWGTDLHIDILAYLPSGTPVGAGIFGYALTVIAVTGVINAFNMIDGIDGLAGLMAIISTSLIGLIIIILGREYIHDTELGIFRGAVGGYLLVNLALVSRRKIFLGDAGSMLIGFVVGWALIYYSQLPPENAMPPSMALWIIALPVADTLVIMTRRIVRGRSPFSPDRKHLHHIFMRLGFSPLQTLAVICLMAIALSIFGFMMYLLFGDIGSIAAFGLMTFGYYFFIRRVWRVSAYIRRRLIQPGGRGKI